MAGFFRYAQGATLKAFKLMFSAWRYIPSARCRDTKAEYKVYGIQPLRVFNGNFLFKLKQRIVGNSASLNIILKTLFRMCTLKGNPTTAFGYRYCSFIGFFNAYRCFRSRLLQRCEPKLPFNSKCWLLDASYQT